MNALEDGLLLAGIPVALILAGYWLAARLAATSPSERLAAAALGGLGILVWNVSVLNFFQPLAGARTWLCLWPVALTLASERARCGLTRDLAALAFHRRGALAIAGAVAFLGFLLWPLLSRPDLVFYDGTANHDAFFWITGAEHLQHHSYMEATTRSAIHPWANYAGAIAGWRPEWGRMGGEGLLALLSSLGRTTPLPLYLAATAALFVPWVAAVYLVARTFLLERLTSPALLALVALQPAFVFFHGNANLPNLLGALAGAVVVVATERSLRATETRGTWLGLLALGLHAVLCCYPEMLPFVAVSAGLLWLRASVAARRPLWAPTLAAIAGLLINPASTVRAWHGLVFSLGAARTQPGWVNIFLPLAPAARAPAMVTLSPHFGHDLGSAGGAVCAVVLLAAAIFALVRARDRFGAGAMLAGPGVLLVYTPLAGFDYGWQKTAQFAAVFLAALVAVGGVDALAREIARRGWRRFAGASAAAPLLAIFGYATAVNCLEAHKWSQRKFITRDWLVLRDYAGQALRDAPVLIDGESFSYPFFHGMWAAYFLADSRVYFAGDDPANGGYLQPSAIDEARGGVPEPRAILVSGDWAASFDADSPRLLGGDSVTLLQVSNRVTDRRGFQPANGVPRSAADHLVLELRPPTRSALRLELAPRDATRRRDAHWLVTDEVDGEETFSTEISGPPPWRLIVPLKGQRSNRIDFTVAPASPDSELWPFTIEGLRVKTIP